MDKLLNGIKHLISVFEKDLEDDWQYAENHEKEYRDKLEMLYLFKEMIEEQQKAQLNRRKSLKYKKKPVVVEAILWAGNNEREVYEFLTGTENTHGRISDHSDDFHISFCNGGCQTGDLFIHTKEGEMKADIGDYIIKEPFPTCDRKFYPCKPDIFDKTYDLVI